MSDLIAVVYRPVPDSCLLASLPIEHVRKNDSSYDLCGKQVPSILPSLIR